LAAADELLAVGATIVLPGMEQVGLEFQGIAPTGRQGTVPGFVFYHVASGKITEFRGLFDGLALNRETILC
jgi:predicted ester cyclase